MYQDDLLKELDSSERVRPESVRGLHQATLTRSLRLGTPYFTPSLRCGRCWSGPWGGLAHKFSTEVVNEVAKGCLSWIYPMLLLKCLWSWFQLAMTTSVEPQWADWIPLYLVRTLPLWYQTNWDLTLALEGLSGALFEPLESFTERFLTLKMVLLLALTSLKTAEISRPNHLPPPVWIFPLDW